MSSNATEHPCFSIGGIAIRLDEAPDIIAASMNKAFSLSRTVQSGDSISLTAATLEDDDFIKSMPLFVRTVYDRLPQNENPIAFAGPNGEYVALVKNEGTASYALIDRAGRSVSLSCHRLTSGKGPLHFQSVLIPALKHLLLLRGKLLIHAGSVAAEDGKGLLFVGLSGAGKTTTCISLTRSGFRYISDDLVVLSFPDGKAVVEGIREHMNLTRQTIEFFPEFSRFKNEFKKNESASKIPVNPEELFGMDRISDKAVIDSIMVINIGKDGPGLVPVNPPAILNVILQNHTFETGLSIPKKSMDILWNILGNVKTYKLLTGYDPRAMGRYVYKEFHGVDVPTHAQEYIVSKSQAARKKSAKLTLPDPAAILNSVLSHTLDNNTNAFSITNEMPEKQTETILKLFSYHRLDPHLATWIKDTGVEDLFSGFSAERVLSNASALALSMEKTAAKIYAELSRAEIPSLIVRGLSVSKRYYPKDSLRFSRDIDFLISKDKLQQAAEILKSLGYKPDRGLDYWGARGEWPFSDGTRIVELHWEAYPHPFNMLKELRGENLWREHDTVKVGSENIPCLSKNNLLLSSFLHAAYEHYLDRLIRLVDIRQMVKLDGNSFDWDWLAEMVRATGSSLAIVKELECMNRVLPIPVPEKWDTSLQPNFFWKTSADLALPNSIIISGKRRFSALRRRLFRSILKYSLKQYAVHQVW